MILSLEGGNLAKMPETQVEDTSKREINGSALNKGKNGNVASENGLAGGSPCSSDTHDQLVQTVIELGLQNDYLKSQFDGFRHFQVEHSRSNEEHKERELEGVKELQEMIESLNQQLLEERQTRGAAEEALKHLQVAQLEVDAKAQELSVKLLEGLVLLI